MQYRIETPAQRDLRHLLDAAEHDAWLAYHSKKYARTAQDWAAESLDADLACAGL